MVVSVVVAVIQLARLCYTRASNSLSGVMVCMSFSPNRVRAEVMKQVVFCISTELWIVQVAKFGCYDIYGVIETTDPGANISFRVRNVEQT